MTAKQKAIKVIKEIRVREKKSADNARFCREHNFNLEAVKFREIEDELRRVCHLLETEFETGFIDS